MCKVSTLRPVEPASLKLLQLNKTLPKIDEVHLSTEHSGHDGISALKKQASLTLPSLVNTKLPDLTSPITKRRMLTPTRNNVTQEFSSAGRLSPEKQNSFAEIHEKENLPMPKSPTEKLPGDGKLLRRRKLHHVSSMPLMHSNLNDSCQEMHSNFETYQRLPSPPKSGQRRPGTPFVLSRSVSSGSKIMQAWVMESNSPETGKECVESSSESALFVKPIDRDKLSCLPKVPGMSNEDKDRVEKLPTKIKMDHSAFKKWIIEQRAS